MKKLYTLLLLVSCLFVATACSDSEESAAASTVKIVKSEVEFSAKAASGTIEVRAAGEVKASSSETWCTVSVSGDIVTVSVPELLEKDSRSALLTITDGFSSVEVPVHQAGVIWSLRGESAYLVKKEANVVTIPVNITCDYTVETSAPWIKGEATDEGYAVALTENDGSYRSGELVFKSSLGEKTYIFAQLGKEGFAGSYTAFYQAPDDNNESQLWKNEHVVLVQDEEEPFSYLIQNLSSFDIPISYDEKSDRLVVKNGSYLGVGKLADGTEAYVYTMILGLGTGDGKIYVSSATSSNYNIALTYGLNEEGKLTFALTDTGTWSGKEIIGFDVEVFSEKKFNNSYRIGYFDTYRYLTFTKNE